MKTDSLFLNLLAFGILTLSGCDKNEKEPEYSIEPYIEFRNLEFIPVEGSTMPDTLNVKFYFRDGDMDLGLSPGDMDSTYQLTHIYLEAGNGKLQRVDYDFRSVSLSNGGSPSFYHILPANKKGLLATIRTRKKVGYGQLPEFNKNCPINSNYQITTILIDEQNKYLFDDTFKEEIDLAVPTNMHAIKDTFYISQNPNAYNIEVAYLVKQSDGSFTEFNWQELYCSSFKGRFPVITGAPTGHSIHDGPYKIKMETSKSGYFEYGMMSVGFIILFKNKTIKLQVKIKDRALHESNVIETSELVIQ